MNNTERPTHDPIDPVGDGMKLEDEMAQAAAMFEEWWADEGQRQIDILNDRPLQPLAKDS